MTDQPKQPPNETPDAALARWDAYWQHGFLTSCADAFRGNYSGSIADFWRAQFANLGDGARLLDVCTGNGAVAALAAADSARRGRSLAIDGVDLARIEPARALADQPALLDAIRFHSRTSVTDMPFDDATFDMACGQYALEYTPLADAVAEIRRVLKPGGRAVFILHHSDSVILTTTREERGHARVIFDEPSIFAAMAALCRKVAAAGSAEARRALASDPHAEALREAVNQAAGRVSAAAAASPHPEMLQTTLDYAQRAFAGLGANGLDAALALLLRGEQEIRANLARLDDLLAAALDNNDLTALIGLFTAHGFADPVSASLVHDKSLIGLSLSATLPAD